MSAPSVVLPDFPGPVRPLVVDPPAIADLGAELLAASARLDDAGSLAGVAGRIDSWEGRSAEAYRVALLPCGRRADAMSLALRAVAHRVDDHAHAMQELAALHGGLVEDHASVTEAVFALTDEVAAWRTRALLSSGVDDPRTAEEGRALRLEAAVLAARVDVLEQRHTTWWDRVRAEESAMVSAFVEVLDLDQVGARWGGVADPADAAWATAPPAGAPAAAVLAWWRSLGPVRQQAVVAAAPGAIGNLDGIPARARDAANRVRLDRDLATLRHLDDLGVITQHERAVLANAEAAADALDRHSADVDAHGDTVPAHLWIYEPEAFAQDGGADGRVAIALGDPDTADHVAVNVPGIGTEATDVGGLTDRSWQLHQSATTADPTQTYASIAWLGYDAPREIGGGDVGDVVGEDVAHRGGDRLASSIAGLRAVGGDDLDVVPVAHSYGSVVLGSTLVDHDLGLDRAVAIGSPGLGRGIDGVEDLGVRELHVGRNHDDLTARLGQNGALGLGGLGHGQDPTDSGYGAQRFQANAGHGHDDHSAYYDNDSESLRNLGAVLADRDTTPAAPVHDPWYAAARDPEEGAVSDPWDTDGDGDTDGIPCQKGECQR